jgi:serine/threonine-protein kinase SRPK3
MSKLIITKGHLLKPSPTSYEPSLVLLLDKMYSEREITQAVDFLSKMLVIDPEQRWSAAQLLQHPWVKG